MAIDIKQEPQFNTDIGDQAGDMGGADLSAGDLGDHSILQAHDEAQQQHRHWHKNGPHQVDGAAKQAKDQQQQGFQQRRER